MNNQVIPDYRIALQLWWAQAWRTIPLVFLLSLLAGFAFGMLAHVLGLQESTVKIVGAIIGFSIGLHVAVTVILRLMTKGFGRYRLVIVEK